MASVPISLEDLGPRICILGPSNSGKSTLAVAIARAREVEAIHLDQLHHRPNSDWQPRPREEFVALHDAAVAGSAWVIEGNYPALLSQRLPRATGLILLDMPPLLSLLRYLRRCWFDRGRHGGLEGGHESVNWAMIRYILVGSRPRRRRYRDLAAASDLPTIDLPKPHDLARFYRSEHLVRPRPVAGQ